MLRRFFPSMRHLPGIIIFLTVLYAIALYGNSNLTPGPVGIRIITAVIFAILVGVPLICKRSFAPFWRSFCIVFFLMFLPLIAFLGSVFFSPMSKTSARFGWVDCFHIGKLALLPIVFWTLAAIYGHMVLKADCGKRLWIRLGYCVGAMVCAVCLMHGVMTIRYLNGPFSLFMLIPVYLFICLVSNSLEFWQATAKERISFLLAMAGTIPLWVWSYLISIREYDRIPEVSGCFIVTAASKGHVWVVGPMEPIFRRGEKRLGNEQLWIFWRFEEFWMHKSSGTHRLFRRFYNIWGYRASRLIRSRWTADMVYILLKPAEWAARFILKISNCN